jgi:hypothetical protein
MLAASQEFLSRTPIELLVGACCLGLAQTRMSVILSAATEGSDLVGKDLKRPIATMQTRNCLLHTEAYE